MNLYIGLLSYIIINLMIMHDIYINARFLTQKLSGVQRYAFEISKELSLINNQYNFILLIPSKLSINCEYDFSFNIKKIGSNKGHLWEQFDLPRYLNKKNNPLLINLTNSAPIFYKNKISTIHDLSVFENGGWFSIKYRSFYKFLIPRIIKSSRKILTDSYFSQKEILNKYNDLNPKDIHVIYCSNSLKTNNNIQKSKDDDYLLFIGGNSRRKNLKNLILAFIKLDSQKIKLKIVGNIINHLKSDNVIEHPNVEYLGDVSNDDLINLYTNAKMLVFPSFYEGFGLPPLEAISFNCPIILSDIPVLREIYEESALYVNPYNIDDIKNKISKFLNDNKLRYEMISLGLKQSKKYSWNKSAIKIIDLIKGLI